MSTNTHDQSSLSKQAVMPKKQELIIIAPAGDVEVIVAGEVRLLVLKSVLSLASKAFAAMLKPTFKEGQQSFSTDKPGLLSFPEDDPVAMATLCSIIHVQFSYSDLTQMTRPQLLILTVLANKYLCLPAIQSVLMCRIQQFRAVPNTCKDALEILAIFYNNQDAEEFRKQSKIIIAEYSDSFVELVTDIVEESLPSNIACKSSRPISKVPKC